MRILFAIVLLLFCTSVLAKPSPEDKKFCAALSSYSHVLLVHKLQYNVTEEQSWATLVQDQLNKNNLIAPVLAQPIKNVIRLIYADEFPLITDPQQVFMFVSEINTACLKEKK